jgi:hypothetical protein
MLLAKRRAYHVSFCPSVDEDACRSTVDSADKGKEAAGVLVDRGERMETNAFAMTTTGAINWECGRGSGRGEGSGGRRSGRKRGWLI